MRDSGTVGFMVPIANGELVKWQIEPPLSFAYRVYARTHIMCLCICMCTYACVYVCLYVHIHARVHFYRFHPSHALSSVYCTHSCTTNHTEVSIIHYHESLLLLSTAVLSECV